MLAEHLYALFSFFYLCFPSLGPTLCGSFQHCVCPFICSSVSQCSQVGLCCMLLALHYPLGQLLAPTQPTFYYTTCCLWRLILKCFLPLFEDNLLCVSGSALCSSYFSCSINWILCSLTSDVAVCVHDFCCCCYRAFSAVFFFHEQWAMFMLVYIDIL